MNLSLRLLQYVNYIRFYYISILFRLLIWLRFRLFVFHPFLSLLSISINCILTPILLWSSLFLFFTGFLFRLFPSCLLTVGFNAIRADCFLLLFRWLILYCRVRALPLGMLLLDLYIQRCIFTFLRDV